MLFFSSDGKFGAYMQVHIQNDGPVTISLETPSPKPPQQKQVSPTIFEYTEHVFAASFFLALSIKYETWVYNQSWSTLYHFPALSTSRWLGIRRYKFSRSFHRWHVFPRLSAVTRSVGEQVPFLANLRWSKHSKSFRFLLSNQETARALTSTPKSIAQEDTSCCLATSGAKISGPVPSRRREFAINWYLFPRLRYFGLWLVYYASWGDCLFDYSVHCHWLVLLWIHTTTL